MKVVKIALWVLLGLVVVAALAAGVLYLMASLKPKNYRPAQLSQAEKVGAAKRFADRVLAEWHNKSPGTVPFTWKITQKELNEYLASMDEIPALKPHSKRGDVHEKMAKAGLAGPAAAMGRDKITFMIRSTEYNKVISADISLEFTSDGRLQIRLVAARVGRLTVPTSFVRDRLKQALVRGEGNRKAKRAGQAVRPLDEDQATIEDIGRMLDTLISRIDEDPIVPEMVIEKKHRVRIDAIDLEPGLVRIHATPLGRVKRKKTKADP